MKKIILRTTLYCLVVMTLSFVFTMTIGQRFAFEVQEVFGFGGIILCMSLVYFGIRSFRDNVNGGVLSFSKGISIGLIIILLPSLLFATMDYLYVELFDPQFYERYYATYAEKMKLTYSGAELDTHLKKLKEEQEFFRSDLVQWGVMFVTVFLIGTILTVLSALILKRKEPKQA